MRQRERMLVAQAHGLEGSGRRALGGVEVCPQDRKRTVQRAALSDRPGFEQREDDSVGTCEWDPLHLPSLRARKDHGQAMLSKQTF